MASVCKVELFIKNEEIETDAEDKRIFIEDLVKNEFAEHPEDEEVDEQEYLIDMVKIETLRQDEVTEDFDHNVIALREECKIENKNSIDSSNIICIASDGEQYKEPTKLFQCGQCSHKTPKSANLKKHIYKRHTPAHLIKWFYCGHCSYKCKEKCELKDHIFGLHREERQVKCTKCDFTTKTKNALRKHLKNKHTSIDFKWWCCDQCSYKTKYERSLQTHMLYKHASEDSIQWRHCEHCSYKARRKGDINRHVLSTHSSLRHKCNICDGEFKRKDFLKSHILTQHSADGSIKWYKCDQCSYKTKCRGNLNKHMGVHSA